MSWSENLQDASFRGVVFDCLRTQDSAPRDVASHEYPYLDGEDSEDLGRKARRLSITAVFFGADYEARLQAFLRACDEAGPGELIHPVYGSIPRAQLRDYQVTHDAETPDYCTVDLSFTEAATGNPFFVQQLPTQAAQAAGQLADVAHSNGTEVFAAALEGLRGLKGNLSRLNALRGVMTGTLANIRRLVQGYIGTALDLVDYPRAFSADVMGMLRRLVDLRSFDRTSVVSDWKSLASQFNQIVLLPSQVAGGAVASTDSGSAATGDIKPIPSQPEDVAKVTAVLQASTAAMLAMTASEILAGEADALTLSPIDVELIANDARTAIQAAIEAHRTLYPVEAARPVTEALKDAALGVQTAAMAVINARPPLIRRSVDAAGNLHLVAFHWYGDYARADELARLNPQLRNPNFLNAGDVLNAYAR
ncbi:DNA circularization N-terminal domain-containing protein [Cupriavidus taiwanensis]|uniref:DNA circularization protein n=1 Tax=Cupriavidus taiwanensis TaxID=164546 RepID=UPI0025400704|nr:DNA circularization N-terminal domain-containing protein [Cupriavidus taiwanensis]MDK3025583.1 DNA circularization N-terminal domain-containing protein [Cupriavidus taiwanensis]